MTFDVGLAALLNAIDFNVDHAPRLARGLLRDV